MDELFEKGYITDPKGKAESVYLTDEDLKLAKELVENSLFHLLPNPKSRENLTMYMDSPHK